MASKPDASEMMDREFLEMRCRVLDIAAALDRIDASVDAESVRLDPRLQGLAEAARILIDGKPDRARRVQPPLTEKRSGYLSSPPGALLVQSEEISIFTHNVVDNPKNRL